MIEHDDAAIADTIDSTCKGKSFEYMIPHYHECCYATQTIKQCIMRFSVKHVNSR